jgi:hypothetical protein
VAWPKTLDTGAKPDKRQKNMAKGAAKLLKRIAGREK